MGAGLVVPGSPLCKASVWPDDEGEISVALKYYCTMTYATVPN